MDAKRSTVLVKMIKRFGIYPVDSFQEFAIDIGAWMISNKKAVLLKRFMSNQKEIQPKGGHKHE